MAYGRRSVLLTALGDAVSPADTRSHELPVAGALYTRAGAEAYVASVCFKHGPPRLLGVELEWTVHFRDDASRPLDRATLRRALGAHSPTTVDPDSPAQPLPSGGLITVEPGGQVEISSHPTESLTELIRVTETDRAYLSALLAASGLRLGDYGLDPARRPELLLDVPRYNAMWNYYGRINGDGRIMMAQTAGLQICVDVGTREQAAARWAAAHEIGPALCALFANASHHLGRPTGRASQRLRTLLTMDPSRSRTSPSVADPAAYWARRALDTPLLCVRRDCGDWNAPYGVTFAGWLRGAAPGTPTSDDLKYHLCTLFPPVRPQGYLEIRYLDAQPGPEWIVPTVLVSALFSSDNVVDRAREIAAPSAGLWQDAADYGLAEPLLASTAARLAELAMANLGGFGLDPRVMNLLTSVLTRRLGKESQHSSKGPAL
ncbi:ergothioneine biosynthesis glutamate--cysteine ligase EgtA [Pseudonocardiaceae bacterium YIM PH 21723]|nr:ergothioneine biosynthesis glutamate--cysteine ligase EgtA [Pseudonocardiaceae bacterium YIM PH 21723]